MFYYRVAVSSMLILAPLVVLVLGLLTLGLGMLLSALNVKFRDIRNVLPFVIQAWVFLSPIVYPTSIVSEKWRWILALNPLTGFIEAFRAALFSHQPMPWGLLGISMVVTLIILVYASFAFKRLERTFADVI
jgi:lipopolysaccharide transport system permease protein